jgi:hypothetical protein
MTDRPTAKCLDDAADAEHLAALSDAGFLDRNLRAQQSPFIAVDKSAVERRNFLAEQSPATGSHPSTGCSEQPLVTEQPVADPDSCVVDHSDDTADNPTPCRYPTRVQPVVARPEAVSEQPLVTRPAVVSVDAQASTPDAKMDGVAYDGAQRVWVGPPDHPGRGNLPLWAGTEPQEPDDDDAPRPVSAPPLNDPPHIHRADLLRALESLGITDTGNVVCVEMASAYVEVTRFVRAADSGGILLNEDRDAPLTTTTRIEIR